MSALAFDFRPQAVVMIQRVTHSRPAVTITAPAPELHAVTYDVLSERNRADYIAQSAATRGGKVADLPRL